MKNFYVATAIPYVNDKPHIGHAMDFVYADILARYHRQVGDNVRFSLGTDEHGAKIAEKASENNLSPQEFVDKIVPLWQDFADKMELSNDFFVRTTDFEHEKRAALIWSNLAEYIYKGKYEGWYCVGCEEYKTETHVKETNGTCPLHNRAYEKLSEENYFFKLSSFTESVTQALESDKLRIIPQFRRTEIMNVVKGGLQDISISRPAEKISWGIPVPGDESQVMYVWFEALMNYITILKYPDGEDFKTFWPANYQVIGKDILRFHAVIWPAMLLGLGLPLPQNLYVHGFVSSDGQKMSKSLGNVIDPIDVISRHGVDAFRYYIARHIPSYDDGDFSWSRFDEAYNNELANELGNAVSRIAAMVVKYQDGVIGEIPQSKHDVKPYHDAIANCKFDRALDLVWDQIRGLNQYIDEEKPWEVAKENDQEHLREVLSYTCSSALEIADLLEPFMPSTAEKIKYVFSEGVIRNMEGSLFPKEG